MDRGKSRVLPASSATWAENSGATCPPSPWGSDREEVRTGPKRAGDDKIILTGHLYDDTIFVNYDNMRNGNMGQIRKKSTSDAVLEEIKRMIRNDDIQEGDKLPNQNDLAAQFGVSRTSSFARRSASSPCWGRWTKSRGWARYWSPSSRPCTRTR